MVLISVVVPVYNTEKYLRKCLFSLVEQTLSDIEIIVINDGSLDNSLEIANEFAKVDSRIRVYSKKNGGLSEARNYGLSKCTGKYVGFVDSDDYVDKNMFKYMYEMCKKNNADMGICGWFVESNNNIKVCDFHQKLIVLDDEKAIDMLLNHVSFDNFACNKIFKRELFKEIKFPVGEVMEDLATIYKLINLSKKIVVDSKPLYYYVLHENSLTSVLNSKLNIRAFEIFANRRNDLLAMYPKLKNKINSNFFTANKLYFMISLRSSERNKAFEQKIIKNMRKLVYYTLIDSSVPIRVRISSLMISIFPYLYFKVRRVICGKKI